MNYFTTVLIKQLNINVTSGRCIVGPRRSAMKPHAINTNATLVIDWPVFIPPTLIYHNKSQPVLHKTN